MHVPAEAFLEPNRYVKRYGPLGVYLGCIKIYYCRSVIKGTYISDKVMVHEWGHLRWGLFDEYPYNYDERFYFSPSVKGIEATRCTTSLQGVYYDRLTYGPCRMDSTNGFYDVNCMFYAHYYQKGELASLMSHNSRDAVSRYFTLKKG